MLAVGLGDPVGPEPSISTRRAKTQTASTGCSSSRGGAQGPVDGEGPPGVEIGRDPLCRRTKQEHVHRKSVTLACHNWRAGYPAPAAVQPRKQIETPPSSSRNSGASRSTQEHPVDIGGEAQSGMGLVHGLSPIPTGSETGQQPSRWGGATGSPRLRALAWRVRVRVGGGRDGPAPGR